MSVVNGLRRTANQLIDTGLSYLPQPTVEHLGNASTELLKAVRILIDEQIAWNARHVANAERIRRERQAARAREAPQDAFEPLATEGPSRPD